MFETNWWQKLKRWRHLLPSNGWLLVYLMVMVLVWGLAGCNGGAAQQPSGISSLRRPAVNIAEVSPPQVIQELRQVLDNYQPQVKILSPQPDEVLQDNTLEVRFQVRDLPLFKNAALDMGPYLHVILDNQPYMAVYDANQPLVLKDLDPGTHTIRAFASRPWHESFKNEGAYAQTTFHIFTKTENNNPNPNQPLLTYSRPKGSYGAEPILLDFYLMNAPLHAVAQENPQDDIVDWRIRCTINGETFTTDKWLPIYLKGFKSGKNWVQLELLDEQGNPIKNAFNDTVRLITYQSGGEDTLSRLVRDELSVADARGIVDPNYTPPVPAIAPTPEPVAEPSPIPTPEEIPTAEQPEQETATPEVEPTQPAETQTNAAKQAEKPKGGFFNRKRREAPAETTPAPEAVIPETEAPQSEDLVTPIPPVEVVPSPEPVLAEPQQAEKSKSGGFFNRLRRPSDEVTPAPSLPPTLPEIIETPAPEMEAPEAVPEPSSEPAVPKSLKEVFLPKPAPTSSPLPIIQAPTEPQIPSRFLQPSAPATSAPEVTEAEETAETSAE